MNYKSTRNLCLFFSLFILTIGFQTRANTILSASTIFPKNPIEVNFSEEWQEYSFSEGVLIEYRMKKLNSQDYGREVNMIVFRFTNTTDETKNCSWTVRIERNNECSNCDNLDDPEGAFQLQLDPKATVEGNASNLLTRSELNIFGNFVKRVPGMSEQRLTAFELINLTIK